MLFMNFFYRKLRGKFFFVIIFLFFCSVYCFSSSFDFTKDNMDLRGRNGLGEYSVHPISNESYGKYNVSYLTVFNGKWYFANRNEFSFYVNFRCFYGNTDMQSWESYYVGNYYTTEADLYKFKTRLTRNKDGTPILLFVWSWYGGLNVQGYDISKSFTEYFRANINMDDLKIPYTGTQYAYPLYVDGAFSSEGKYNMFYTALYTDSSMEDTQINYCRELDVKPIFGHSCTNKGSYKWNDVILLGNKSDDSKIYMWCGKYPNGTDMVYYWYGDRVEHHITLSGPVSLAVPPKSVYDSARNKVFILVSFLKDPDSPTMELLVLREGDLIGRYPIRTNKIIDCAMTVDSNGLVWISTLFKDSTGTGSSLVLHIAAINMNTTTPTIVLKGEVPGIMLIDQGYEEQKKGALSMAADNTDVYIGCAYRAKVGLGKKAQDIRISIIKFKTQ